MTVGENIRRIRQERNLTQRQLGEMVGNCIYIFPYPFYEENSSQYNYCCNDQDPFCKKKSSEEIFLLQLLFSFPYFSFHNSESFPVHLAKIIQGMTGKFKMSRAVLEIQFLDLEKGHNLFS